MHCLPQGVLYHEHQEAKGAWQSEREGLVQERAGLVAQREKDQLQLQEFKVLMCVCAMYVHNGSRVLLLVVNRLNIAS